MGIPDHLTCLLRNLYAGQEATVRSGHGTTDWFKIEKGVHQDAYCYPAYLTNAMLVDSFAGTKIARRNINNFRYIDDTTLMKESKKEFKRFFFESEKRTVKKLA